MRMKLALLLVQILLLAFFLPAGVLKIVGHAHMRHEFSRFRLPYAWARWAGAVELLACVLLLAGFRKALLLAVGEIGRAAGRERVCKYVYISVVCVPLQK